jgi:hypothetical protein
MSESASHGEQLFSTKVVAGSRTYFVDVQRAATGVKYLKISESRRGEHASNEHCRVMVFEEHIAEFLRALKEAVPFIGEEPPRGCADGSPQQHPTSTGSPAEEEDAWS